MPRQTPQASAGQEKRPLTGLRRALRALRDKLRTDLTRQVTPQQTLFSQYDWRGIFIRARKNAMEPRAGTYVYVCVVGLGPL